MLKAVNMKLKAICQPSLLDWWLWACSYSHKSWQPCPAEIHGCTIYRRCPHAQSGNAKGALVGIHQLFSGHVAPAPLPLALINQDFAYIWAHSTLKLQSNAPSVGVFVKRWADPQRRGITRGDRVRTDCSQELRARVTCSNQKTRQNHCHPQRQLHLDISSKGHSPDLSVVRMGNVPLYSRGWEGALAWEATSLCGLMRFSEWIDMTGHLFWSLQ